MSTVVRANQAAAAEPGKANIVDSKRGSVRKRLTRGLSITVLVVTAILLILQFTGYVPNAAQQPERAL